MVNPKPLKMTASSDWLWTAPKIGAFIDRTPGQVYDLYSRGVFKDAVWKVGNILVGSKQKLRDPATLLASEPETTE
jgi:hypothetical protein